LENPDNFIIINDDEPTIHTQSCDNDKELEDCLRVIEMQSIIAPNGVVIKVEKDW